jgi:type II secretion system protein G
MHRDTRAFTLIELLIVVAIIAILAAIAVPNFLEAQTRSKVSRAQADMRSITTALEAYRIDWNAYPSPSEAHDPVPWGPGSTSSYNPFHSRVGSNITTPVAYMTSLPFDPFSAEEAALESAYTYDAYTHIVSRFAYWNFDFFDAAGFSSSIYQAGKQAAGKWLLYSPGPDNNVNNGGGTGSFYTPYDATNGTISHGNIFRTQRDPGGLDYLTFRQSAGF